MFYGEAHFRMVESDKGITQWIRREQSRAEVGLTMHN